MKKFILAAFLILGLLASGCGGAPTEKKADEKLTVVVSFNAMKEFTQAVGGDAIHVVSLIPEGTEPHGFSPTADQMKTLHNAKLLIVHGLGMEPWAQKIAETSGNPNLIVVEASKGVTPIPLEEEDEDNHGAEEKEHHHHGPYDPHAWLSLTAAQVEVQNIADALSQADPVHKETYKKMPLPTRNSFNPFIRNTSRVLKRLATRILLPAMRPLVTFAGILGSIWTVSNPSLPKENQVPNRWPVSWITAEPEASRPSLRNLRSVPRPRKP